MRETITMTTIEQRRAWVLTKVMAGEIEVVEAAERSWQRSSSVYSRWPLSRRAAADKTPRRSAIPMIASLQWFVARMAPLLRAG
jgi:hypothetical protein